MSSGLLVIPGVSTLPCLPLMLSLKTIILKLILVCVFLVSPCCVHRNRRPDPTVSVVPSPRFVLFVFSSVFLFLCFVPRGKRVRTPRALMLAVRGSLCRCSRLSHPAVRGSLRRRSRLSHPAVRGSLRRRSRLCHPAVRGSSRRRSRINQPSVHWRWRHHPRLTLAYRPAADSMPAGPPLTQCPPACLWLNARRPASDSSPPDCRWLKLAGLPLTQARRIAADSWPLVVVGRESQLTSQFTPPSAAHRPRRSREITPPSVGKANPPSAAASSIAGKANPPSAVHSARSRLRLPPARRSLPLCGQARRLLPLFVKPAGYGLASRPLPYWQASRPWPNLTRLWPRSF